VVTASFAYFLFTEADYEARSYDRSRYTAITRRCLFVVQRPIVAARARRIELLSHRKKRILGGREHFQCRRRLRSVEKQILKPAHTPCHKGIRAGLRLEHAAAGQIRIALLGHEDAGYRPDSFGLHICWQRISGPLERAASRSRANVSNASGDSHTSTIRIPPSIKMARYPASRSVPMTWGRTKSSMKWLIWRRPMTLCNPWYTAWSTVMVSFFCIIYLAIHVE